MGKSALRVVGDETQGYGTPLPVKLSRIERFEGQPRQWFDPTSVEELADDIQENGQLQPVKLAKHQDKPGVFVLIGGERRWRAFHLIWKRTGTEPIVDAFIKIVQDYSDLYRQALLDNLRRENLVPLDEAASYYRLRTDDKMSVPAIAKMVGKSDSHVSNYLKMHTLPEAVKQLMDPALKEQQLSVTSAIDIAYGTHDPALQLSLAKEAVERELGVAETRMLIGLKTGVAEASWGGRLRKPSDDYRVFAAFIGRTRNVAARFERTHHILSMYHQRPNEADDRQRDAAKLREALIILNRWLKEMEKR